MEHRIEKRIELHAPLARVWQAITDYRQFNQWFRVNLESPFIAGQIISGNITYPGYEHLRMTVTVQSLEPERHFSFTWHPHPKDPGVDYSAETPTLVEFHLEPTAGGTLLTLTESGFEHLPAHRIAEAFRGNDQGWTEQMKNIEAYVSRTS